MNITLIQLLLKLKNASLARKEIVIIKYNKSCLDLLKLLYIEGFIQSFNIQTIDSPFVKKHLQISITLRYFYNKPIFKDLKIVSKPSYVKYLKLKDLCKIVDKKSVLFLSTNKGLLTSLDCKKHKVGGTLLFIV
jgi:ribosomal protein S8